MNCNYPSYYSNSYYPENYSASTMRQQPVPQTTLQSPIQPSNPMGYFAGPTYGVATIPVGGVREESFIENILRFNKGKVGTFYFTYQGNSEWNAMVYHGRVETAGRDHIIISEPSTGKRFLLLMSNLDWVEFDEKVNYPATTISPEVQQSLTSSE